MKPERDCIKTWHKKPYTLRLFYLGGEKLGYEFKYGRKVIFTGKDYRPSPLHAIDSLDSVYGLLSFLSCQPGDTDEEYFADYTLEQTEFVKAHGETLSMLVFDYEERVK